ncbi:MAG: hypothetical protein QXQ29_01985 [Candidatus Bathyarchaeia archaeon]
MEAYSDILWLVSKIVVVVAAGWIVGILLGRLARVLVIRLKVDDHLEKKTYIGKQFKDTGIRISSIVDVLVRIYVYAVAFHMAAIMTDIQGIINLSKAVVDFIPFLIFGIFVMIIGFIFSDYLVRIVIPTSVKVSTVIGSALRGILYLISILAGLTAMKLEIPILTTLATALIWSTMLGLAIGLSVALALGLKDVVARRAEDIVSSIGLGLEAAEEKLKMDRIREVVTGLRSRIKELEAEVEQYRSRLREMEEARKIKLEELSVPTIDFYDRLREIVKGRGEVREVYGGLEVEVLDLENFPWCEVLVALKGAGFDVIFTKRDEKYVVIGRVTAV